MSSLALSVTAEPWALSFGVLQQARPAGFACQPRGQWGDDSWSLELSAPRPVTFAVTAWLPGTPADVDCEGPWSLRAGRLSCSVTGGSGAVRARWTPAAR